MLVVAGLEKDRLALKTIVKTLLIAIVALQFDDLLLMAEIAKVIPILSPCHINQNMILLAFGDNRPLFV
jgi:hypothetical protein